MGKHVLSNNITSTARQPYTKVTHEYYNAMITENIAALGYAVTNGTSSPVVLYGCVNSDSPNANITAGAVFYQGEIYLCDAFIDATISNAIVGTITTTYDASDPVLFSNNSSYNVHQNKKIVWSDAVSGSGDFDYDDVVFFQGDWIAANADVFYKRVGAEVSLIGMLGSGFTANTITLPVGYRPAAAQSFKVAVYDMDGGSSIVTWNIVTISTGGVVACSYLSGAGTARIVDLRGISFNAA